MNLSENKIGYDIIETLNRTLNSLIEYNGTTWCAEQSPKQWLLV